MNNQAKPLTAQEGEGPAAPHLQILEEDATGLQGITSGIGRLDERLGGLEEGGVYLFAGPPGPAKLVAALHFLHAGVTLGEKTLLLSSVGPPAILDVARAWGIRLDRAWEDGSLRIFGFRDDFEMRVLRSTDPDDVLKELDRFSTDGVSRIAVDPGSLFLQGGNRTRLGRAFLDWAGRHPATVCATFSIDSGSGLPSAAEWLVHAATGIFLMDRRSDGLHQVQLSRAIPGAPGGESPITLQLTPGKGLEAPDRFPARRRSDRPAGDSDSLLLVSLGGPDSTDLETWARSAFKTQVVTEPLEAVAELQAGGEFGGILVHAPRQRIREAIRACRAIRPMTGAAIVVASDDQVRSTDRVEMLKTGADDCLSGGVDFRELEARIHQAVAAGGKAAPVVGLVGAVTGQPVGGKVPWDVFGKEVRRRSADPALAVFSIVSLHSGAASLDDLETAAAKDLRDEDGDLVTSVSNRCVVLLQGARREPAQAFVRRFTERLSRDRADQAVVAWDLLSFPSDAGQIEAMFEESSQSETPPPPTTGPGGSGGSET
jgi:CheY-like chemotaxis protein